MLARVLNYWPSLFAYNIIELRKKDNDLQQCGMCNQQNLRPDCAYAQSDQRLFKSSDHAMPVKLQTKQYLEYQRLKENCTFSSESTIVKMKNCKKSHVMALIKVSKDSDQE